MSKEKKTILVQCCLVAILLASGTLFLVGTSKPEDADLPQAVADDISKDQEVASAEPEPNLAPKQVEITQISQDDEKFICRGAIAEIMGRDLTSVRSVRRADQNIGTSYIRPSDGTRWQNVCKIQGETVLWAALQDSGQIGRWRDDPADEVVTFKLYDDELQIFQKFGDGSSTSGTFKRD